MSKEKNRRRTPAEQAIHEEAVRLRRLTDRQLVEQFHRAAEPEMAASAPSVAQDGAEGDTPIGNTSAVQALLTALSEGKCKGVKGATAYKVAQFAAEMGLV